MFDTMTMTKIVGGVCGTLLFFLFGAWAADAIYGLGEQPKAEERTFAYAIAVEGGEEVAATADAAAGEKVYGKCKSCHSIEGKDMTGPHMNGVVGRARASIAGYTYSEAMASAQTPWTGDELYAFLKAPKEYVPGTKMGFAGIAAPQDRANLIAYLATTK